MDAYGRSDVLQEFYQYNNEPFIDYLKNLENPSRVLWVPITAPNFVSVEDKYLKRGLGRAQDINSELKGMVACQPKDIQFFSGIALTLKDFDPVANFKDKILVTCQTDPGWTIIFPFLKGLVVERGGMLSHAAIVARELNIPCIVGIENATDLIANGANIKLDLLKGEVYKL